MVKWHAIITEIWSDKRDHELLDFNLKANPRSSLCRLFRHRIMDRSYVLTMINMRIPWLFSRPTDSNLESASHMRYLKSVCVQVWRTATNRHGPEVSNPLLSLEINIQNTYKVVCFRLWISLSLSISSMHHFYGFNQNPSRLFLYLLLSLLSNKTSHSLLVSTLFMVFKYHFLILSWKCCRGSGIKRKVSEREVRKVLKTKEGKDLDADMGSRENKIRIPMDYSPLYPNRICKKQINQDKSHLNLLYFYCSFYLQSLIVIVPLDIRHSRSRLLLFGLIGLFFLFQPIFEIKYEWYFLIQTLFIAGFGLDCKVAVMIHVKSVRIYVIMRFVCIVFLTQRRSLWVSMAIVAPCHITSKMDRLIE